MISGSALGALCATALNGFASASADPRAAYPRNPRRSIGIRGFYRETVSPFPLLPRPATYSSGFFLAGINRVVTS
jgi:hypothetical protein